MKLFERDKYIYCVLSAVNLKCQIGQELLQWPNRLMYYAFFITKILFIFINSIKFMWEFYFRGRFSVILNVWVKESNTSSVAKVIQTTDYADGKNEYEIIKSLCHEKIVMFYSASFKADKTVLVMEKLSGVDVMSFLALRHDYNEELVVTIIKQVTI